MSSEIEDKAEAVLDTLDQNISDVTEKLKPFLTAPSIDALSENEANERKAIPYTISAYALSSMLFAYLRGEGKDISVLAPELQRVKEKMEKVNKAYKSKEEVSSKKQTAEDSSSMDVDPKPSGKHTVFDKDGKKVKHRSKSPTEGEVHKKKKKKAVLKAK